MQFTTSSSKHIDDMYKWLPVQGLSEKGIDNLRADLAKTDAECEEEIRRAVYDNYQHFIGVTQVLPAPSLALYIPRS